MKARKPLSVVSLVLLSSVALSAQDPLKVDPAHYKVVLENPSVRVLKIDYPPGSKSVMHQHPDAIFVSLAAARARFTMADGTSQDVDMAAESASYTPAQTHTPSNIGSGAVDGVLIEFKAAAPGTATLPTSRPNMTVKMLAEGPRGAAYLSTADAAFHEAAGAKHDFDQVVITLSDAKMALSIDGKPAKTNWARGDVAFIGRGVEHESQNISGKPVDYVVVLIK
jgi:quercetin dioxygenase-like cupin family protein